MPRTPRVLVVDDDHVIATTLALILSRNGFEAVAAFSGPEALQHAYKSHFDVLLSDVVMEPLNGVRLAVIFRNLNPVAKIVLFTGTEDAAQLMLAAANAGHDFKILRKPIHPGTILEELREQCSEARSV
ncbi:response regulator [Occallatibacter savannae]|uniref:response regulator n=1 Tax=Occallatibacter savannae TaxID=1002691 RepID=UPI0013A57919|nr:response regulator [Occallatibacter savannae]